MHAVLLLLFLLPPGRSRLPLPLLLLQAVLVHQLSKGATQNPFRKNKVCTATPAAGRLTI
jgi:hypothetical protein